MAVVMMIPGMALKLVWPVFLLTFLSRHSVRVLWATWA